MLPASSACFRFEIHLYVLLRSVHERNMYLNSHCSQHGKKPSLQNYALFVFVVEWQLHPLDKYVIPYCRDRTK
jgi:hypothetical protein